MLSFTDGNLIGPASYQIRELILSTYKMNTALNGCPLVDVNGNFVGVYFQRGKRTAFVPMNKILEFLGYPGTTRHCAADTNDGPDSNSWSLLYKDQDALKGRDLDLFPLGESVVFSSEEAALSLSLE